MKESTARHIKSLIEELDIAKYHLSNLDEYEGNLKINYSFKTIRGEMIDSLMFGQLSYSVLILTRKMLKDKIKELGDKLSTYEI